MKEGENSAPGSVELQAGAEENNQQVNFTPATNYSPAPPLPEMTVQEKHKFCLEYRALVRSGGTPSPFQDRCFLLFSREVIEAGGGEC